MKHVLHWVCAFAELIEHDDKGFAFMDAEPSVRVVAGSLGVVVDYRHGNVAQVHVGYVNVGVLITQAVSNTLQ